MNILYAFIIVAVLGLLLGAGLAFADKELKVKKDEKLELTPVRKSFKGVPITFISAGIMALAFMAFDSSLLANLSLV